MRLSVAGIIFGALAGHLTAAAHTGADATDQGQAAVMTVAAGAEHAALAQQPAPAEQPASAEHPAPAGHSAPPEPPGFWTGPVNDPVPATIKGGKIIHAGALAALLKAKDVVLIDVSNAPRRPENLPASTTWLPLPHQAIPGAIWIPGAGLGEPPPPLDRYFRERLAKVTGNDMARPLVVYCHERCWLSWNGAKRAIQYGYRNVYWFPDGIEGWRKAKLPVTVTEPEATP